jgi:hypothetical protein
MDSDLGLLVAADHKQGSAARSGTTGNPAPPSDSVFQEFLLVKAITKYEPKSNKDKGYNQLNLFDL